VRELHLISLIEEKETQHTHTHTQDSDTEDDITPALMNQHGPIVHEQDLLCGQVCLEDTRGTEKFQIPISDWLKGHYLYYIGD
jgi:hypothetical protein